LAPTLPRHTRLETGLLPGLRFPPRPLQILLKLFVPLAEILDRLLRKQLLEGPLLNILRFVLLKLLNVLHRALKDRALVLLAAWDNLGELVDALVDGFSAASLHCEFMSACALTSNYKVATTHLPCDYPYGPGATPRCRLEASGLVAPGAERASEELG
jgi:hypothetical protein